MVGIFHRKGSQRHFDLPRVAPGVALLIVIVGVATTLATVVGGPDWGMIGHDSTNTRNQPFEHIIGPTNVGLLTQKWVSTTAGDVSATPAVVNGAVYFGDLAACSGSSMLKLVL